MSGRRVHLGDEMRNPDGSTGLASALLSDTSVGVLKSYVCFDTRTRRYGRVGAGGNAVTLPADKEMGAYYMDVSDHQPGKIQAYQGTCAGFSMTEHVGKDNYFLVMLIMANGDDLTAAAIADLQAWGLYNDASTPSRTLAATDKLAFIGRNGLEQGAAFEVRAVAAKQLFNGAGLIGGVLI